jgi:maltose alpha-D-glucosyltransferase/alpha-amylase
MAGQAEVGRSAPGGPLLPTPCSLLSSSPDWYLDAIFYKLPVKSFFDSTGDGLGDFPGLTRKLDYLAELGVTCLWLLPFFPSPWRDDGYDVTDYRAVHPAYGGIDDFQRFLDEAHQRGIRVAAEMVINHTSDQHPWFLAARAAPPGSPLRDFYLWSDSDRKYAEARVLHGNGRHSNWTWDPVARAYYWHRFFAHQPDLNYDNPAVRDEMARVLRFWLDRGIDGLCLNGVSYLFEREGTRCENLPETHALLKELRGAFGSAYPGRMLQAGVSAWPADVRPYFGAGDECHMAPNLPLAPRLFLAVRQEDRHPVADLLRQTPTLPPGCQWVLLLRNHDELTLGLATDEERDYMYRVYAADARMRLHGGIRRRLAPLLDNSRPRIELLLGLLFSLPGAPVLYYGDEIGMGDNIYLGGRDPVRTPMQWSGDRNAGFSEADAARLYSPPVSDPVHGYPAVNVDAQLRDPSSLFHWVRRLVALRKHTPTLARGSLELLEPSNRKVLAYLRRYEDDVVLVVSNLARSVQPVELDLSAVAGLIPVEMFDRTAFPRVGTALYFLTLGPHAFYWFQLRRTVEDVTARLPGVETEEVETVPVLRLKGGWETVLGGESRQTLERDVLPNYLRAQRWFGGKARRVEEVRLADWGALESDRAYLAFLTVRFGDGTHELYFLPLGITTGTAAARMYLSMKPWMLARLTGPDGDAVLHDALADDETCRAVLVAVGAGREFATEAGRVHAIYTAAFAELRGDPNVSLPVIRGPATSSNSLVLYGRRLLLKVFRRLEVGTNPDVEVGRYLTETSPFERTPHVAGTIEYRRPNSGPVSLAIVQALVPNQGDGWSHAVGEVRRYLERASGRMFGPDPVEPDPRPLPELARATPPPAVLETIGTFLHAAATLGRRTGELHRVLAAEPHDPAFAPELFTPTDAEAMRDGVEDQAERALGALRDNVDRLPESVGPSARRLLKEGHAVLAHLSRPPAVGTGARKIRCHGDYHLGQVLWVENDFVILDFEGEPTRSVEQRRAKQSPLKDVAGMLRSFHYAAYAGLFAFTRDRPDDFGRLEPWAALWYQWASAAFLAAYCETVGGAGLLPAEPEAFAALLDAFMLEKAFYELAYELNNRPDWVRIPLSGIEAACGLSEYAKPQATLGKD